MHSLLPLKFKTGNNRDIIKKPTLVIFQFLARGGERIFTGRRHEIAQFHLFSHFCANPQNILKQLVAL